MHNSAKCWLVFHLRPLPLRHVVLDYSQNLLLDSTLLHHALPLLKSF